jgi:hypothetical protein
MKTKGKVKPPNTAIQQLSQVANAHEVQFTNSTQQVLNMSN